MLNPCSRNKKRFGRKGAIIRDGGEGFREGWRLGAGTIEVVNGIGVGVGRT
jgi:hypothetical protein